ncbi:MAG: T9SS type A sorting domain-containing protein [Melioribacteraceae bacterium]
MKTKLFVLFFCGLFSNLNAQLKESYYLLSRMNYEFYEENKFEVIRTLKASEGNASNHYYSSWSYTTGVFTGNKTTYHLIADNWVGQIYPGDGLTIKLINVSTGREERLTSYPPSQYDVVPTYYPSNESRILQTTNGFLIFSFPYSLAKVQKDSFFYIKPPQASGKFYSHLIGRVFDKYLVACDTTHTSTAYFLEDFETINEPTFNKKINVVGAKLLDKIYYLQDSLYFISTNSGSGIARLTKDTFAVVHTMPARRETYSYRNSRLYFRTNYGDYLTGLAKQEYSKNLNTFLPEQKLLFGSHLSAIDALENYYATLKADTLMIYSFVKDSLIFKKKIQPPVDVRKIFIDPPYVYFEHFDKTVDIESEQSLPDKYSLSQNYPNPFNPETTISYKLPVASNVSLKVYDVLGREIATLVDEYRIAGSYNSQFSISNSALPSGIYIYRLLAGGISISNKMVLLK